MSAEEVGLRTNTRDFFAALEERLAALEPKDVFKLRRDWIVLLLMLGGVVLTLPSMLGVRNDWMSWLAAAGLLLEACGFCVFTYRQVRDTVPEFIDAKQKYAVELDASFLEHEQLVAWLSEWPRLERDRYLAYIDSRLDSMSLRYPIVFGAVDKLGILPMLVGLFMQIQAINQLSLLMGILGVSILVLYGMGLWMTRFRLQLLSYSRLLHAAKAREVATGRQ